MFPEAEAGCIDRHRCLDMYEIGSGDSKTAGLRSHLGGPQPPPPWFPVSGPVINPGMAGVCVGTGMRGKSGMVGGR